MKNKLLIQKACEKANLKLVCYDENIEKISKKELEKVLPYIEETTDIDVMIRKKIFVVEVVCTMDNEVDLNLLTQDEYISRYGSSRWEED